MNVLAEKMVELGYKELDALTFYKEIFEDNLDTYKAFTPGKYIGIAQEISKNKGKASVHSVYVYKGLEGLQEVIDDDAADKDSDFRLSIIAPVGYAGTKGKGVNKRTEERMRELYALVTEVDNLVVKDGRQVGLGNLLHQMEYDVIPRATYMSCSGSGIHLWYKLEEPLSLIHSNLEKVKKYKRELDNKLCNKYVTRDKNPQAEGISQGFRIIGTRTKSGDTCRVFRLYNLERIKELEDVKVEKSGINISKASKLWPEWYKRRVVNKEEKGHWTFNEALYNNYLRRIREEVVAGSRYNSICCLVSCGEKCGIDRDVVLADALSLLDTFEARTVSDLNHFTKEEILKAVESTYRQENDLYFWRLDTVERKTGLIFPRTKRNGRSQERHLAIAREDKAFKKSRGLLNKDDGRPALDHVVKAWRLEHPDGTKAQCIKETGLSKPTVYKWW